MNLVNICKFLMISSKKFEKLQNGRQSAMAAIAGITLSGYMDYAC
jgi:hypothetical protein